MYKIMGFFFNADRCIGCKACEIACRNENNTLASVRWRRVTKMKNGMNLSISCNHCDSPECFRVCPERAFTKRKDGVVQINSTLCTGCKLCVTACPYEAPQFDQLTQKVSKCQMCYTRLDQNLLPACVEACATASLRIVNLYTFKDKKSIRTIEGFPDIRLTKPSIVFYPINEKKRYFLT